MVLIWLSCDFYTSAFRISTFHVQVLNLKRSIRKKENCKIFFVCIIMVFLICDSVEKEQNRQIIPTPGKIKLEKSSSTNWIFSRFLDSSNLFSSSEDFANGALWTYQCLWTLILSRSLTKVAMGWPDVFGILEVLMA